MAILPAPILDGAPGPIFVITYVYATINTPNSVTIQWSTPVDLPNSYKVQYSIDNFATIAGTYNTSSTTQTITGLTAGTTYQVRVRGYYGANATGLFGDAYQISFSTPLPANNGGGGNIPPTTAPGPIGNGTYLNPGVPVPGTPAVTPTPSPITYPNSSTAYQGNSSIGQSIFKVNAPRTVGKASIAYKALGFATTSNYYMFGSTVFFDSSVDGTQASGGIGFFVSGGGDNGYYIQLQTTNNLATKDGIAQEVSIWKHYANQRVRLPDNQKGVAKSFNGLYGGLEYKIDAKVKITSNKVVIDVYVNNLKITATDTTVSGTTDPLKTILPVTDGMAMFSTLGTVKFDYIYGIPMTVDQYDNSMLYNIYTGKFAASTLNFLYGEKMLDNLGTSGALNGSVEDFGTIARELRKVNIKYTSRPGYPLYPSVGTNTDIQVLGSKLSNFGAEVYLLNNSGTYVPLDDSKTSSFSIIGNYIVPSGEYEYIDTTSNEYDNPEPATFDSTWIQSEGDAKNISKWIKQQWSKQQSVVNIDVFGNPLISVGDIVVINYPSNDLDGTQKFVVTNVSNSYNEGLETTITCRSIYS